MRSLSLFFLFLSSINYNLVNSDQPNGTLCILKNGEPGVCSDLSNCHELKELLIQRKLSRNQITICNRTLRYICCPLPSSSEEGDVGKANDQFYPCGSSGRPVSLIINGTQSERGAWPWLVTLHSFQTNNLFCGGTLISSNAVVTVSKIKIRLLKF